MKVFFTTTPRFKKDNKEIVKNVFEISESIGCEHVSDYLLKVNIDDFYKSEKDNKPIYYEEIMRSLKKADVIIFEVSMASLGVGLLLEKALEMGKGVVALHQKDKYPFFLGGVKDEKLIIEEYNEDDLKKILKSACDYLSNQIDTRFNFFISPKIGNYLDWVAKKLKKPRAVYLRELIEKDMEKNKGYTG